MTTNFIRILVSKQEDMYVAQCLEHDVAVQAADLDTLRERLACTLLMEDDLASIEPAPEKYQSLWDAAWELESPIDNTSMRLAA